ncbi:uncharacterized protein LOC111627148 [Centruroides sculpturatus]|uniref:uncharacterized protein LOC111627148 n=1 Tax=Centruroides sculpturatus TaxID=218467 RepID=UPI000C6D07B2|nr:uncharacterized protein LOC111627148 [Centruroides sculpturatus]
MAREGIILKCTETGQETYITTKNKKLHPERFEAIFSFCQAARYQRIGIEREYATFAEIEKIKAWFPSAKIVPISAQKLRIVKTTREIKLIRRAALIALQALEKLKPHIKAGVSEKELDAKLEFFLRQGQADKSSFDAIIASGPRSALPHGRASQRVLAEGEFVTIDFGALYQGYACDITRNFHVGKVTNPELLRIEKVVREAQSQGIQAVKPGVKTSAIDKICRDYITEQGYGKYFVHSTGHGLGIDVHELPYVSNQSAQETELKPGMVITVEPGIYIPNLGGVRIEDDVLVTPGGHQVLSRS